MSAPYWLNNDTRTFMARGYLRKGDSPEGRMRVMADAAGKHIPLPGFADKFHDYLTRGWYSIASPVWANFGLKRGLPISCNGSYVADDTLEILRKAGEIGAMTKFGAGTSAFLGDIRPRGSSISDGGTAFGTAHFSGLFEKITSVISQENTRPGAIALYLPIEHDDFDEFIGAYGESHPIQHANIGVVIRDEWMEQMLAGDKAKQKRWAAVVAKRFQKGRPYVFFVDAANRGAPEVYRSNGLKIHCSNLCTEIGLSSDRQNSFVCCLSSMNLLHYHEWKDTDAVQTLMWFLDAVMQEYIDKAKGIDFLADAVRFAESQRAVGLGVLGYHSFLQSEMLPFGSLQSRAYNVEIHKLLQRETHAANLHMGALMGSPKLLRGTGLRCATTMAIAPTTSSSFILGQVSPSIEPLNSNYFIKDLEKGRFTYQNPALKSLLARKQIDTAETWKEILMAGGSVANLACLSDHEKDVFKTFIEISQREVVDQAASRQPFIDQAQSLNLMIHPSTPPREVSELMIHGWRRGLKSFYYQRGQNAAQSMARSLTSCTACEA